MFGQPETPVVNAGDLTRVVRVTVLVPYVYEVAVKTGGPNAACEQALQAVKTGHIRGRYTPEDAGEPFVSSVCLYSRRDSFESVPEHLGYGVLKRVFHRILSSAKLHA